MDKYVELFQLNNYKVSKQSTKSTEFEHNETGEVIYLLPNKELTIILDPKKIEGNSMLEEKTSGLIHNTSFNAFPKRKHTGKELIQYGYGFKFQSEEELQSFLVILN
ncbi:hypothetical protein BC6307_20560 [Sutcliffiella cohnii]|uniref:Uncharacterized protein n=1 Tax=Sutcliffiella cohnii TaxID=33932 RepID=A0A223KVJ3_9BACI|nr:hypothetical protein [Sutcliffiella cohnii]AST93489.1 hypothetical protein BC6307_20560 [Sutcliffiella cohnii]